MKKHSETALKVLELKAMGGSVHSISKTLSISERQTRKSLDLIYNEIRDGLLSNFISENLPGQIAEHLELNRIIIRRCMVISSASTDYRVQIEALRLANQMAESSGRIYSDANLIGTAVRKSIVVVHQSQQQQEQEQQQPSSITDMEPLP
ncbi:MAG: hypothetical protein WCF23_18430 [Candidatus Nitrosopolaris sp.]